MLHYNFTLRGRFYVYVFPFYRFIFYKKVISFDGQYIFYLLLIFLHSNISLSSQVAYLKYKQRPTLIWSFQSLGSSLIVFTFSTLPYTNSRFNYPDLFFLPCQNIFQRCAWQCISTKWTYLCAFQSEKHEVFSATPDFKRIRLYVHFICI